MFRPIDTFFAPNVHRHSIVTLQWNASGISECCQALGGPFGMFSFHRARNGLTHLFGILVLALSLSMGSASASAQAADADQVSAAAEDLSVPLADALRQFGQDSGYDVVFPEALVAGKHAAPVQNAQTAYDRLDQLLAGSGLVPRFTRRNAFILEPAGMQAAADLSLDRIEVLTSPFAGTEAEYRWYGEKLLEASLRVLRQSSELELRAYDFTLYVWLSQEGQVERLQGYGGADHQEALLIAKQMLRGAFVGGVPPANMPQPVGLRIVAQ